MKTFVIIALAALISDCGTLPNPSDAFMVHGYSLALNILLLLGGGFVLLGSLFACVVLFEPK